MSLETVASIIAKTIHCNIEDIKPDTKLESLGLTSLDTITVLFDLEEAYDIEIPNEVIPSIVTVNDILDKLNGH
jgi:acyl carrier protein